VFRNREEAAQRIAGRLVSYRGQNPLVLAIPRGGVPMGRVVADALEGELDVVLVHKLGAPGNPEYAIGSVDESGHIEVTGAVARYGIGRDYIDREAREQLVRMSERRALYGRPPAQVEGRTVIVVDDGVATGSTLLAALKSLRARGPARLIAAVGVAPPEAVGRLEAAADEVICLDTPADFYAVGQFFREFDQVSDDEVIRLLGGGRK
jgi:putative phosphoribosyl transferase